MTCKQQIHKLEIVGPRRHDEDRTAWRDSLQPCRWTAARLRIEEGREIFTVSEPEGLHLMRVVLNTPDEDEFNEYMRRVYSTKLVYHMPSATDAAPLTPYAAECEKLRQRPHLRGETPGEGTEPPADWHIPTEG